MISSLFRISLFSLTTLFATSSITAYTPNQPAQHNVPALITNKIDDIVAVLNLKGARDITAIIALVSALATLVSVPFSNQDGIAKFIVASLTSCIITTILAWKMTRALQISEELKRLVRERIVPVYGVL